MTVVEERPGTTEAAAVVNENDELERRLCFSGSPPSSHRA